MDRIEEAVGHDLTHLLGQELGETSGVRAQFDSRLFDPDAIHPGPYMLVRS